MSIAQTVTEVLREHVTLEVESIDRMYLNLYVPKLQYEGGIASFFRYHRGATFASSALIVPLSSRHSTRAVTVSIPRTPVGT